MQRGFTLVEMLISVAIFATVMTIALGALLSMSESDRKAQTLKSVINNLNFSLDAMSRAMRTGTTYHCGAIAVGTAATVLDCPSTPATGVAFKDSVGQTIRYCRGTPPSTCDPAGTAILVSKGSGGYAPLTAAEVSITNLQFYVSGSQGAAVQPHIIILLSGSVPVSGTQNSTFDLQTSVTQRLYDLP